MSRALITAALLAVLAAGCGGDGEKSVTEPAAPTVTPTPTDTGATSTTAPDTETTPSESSSFTSPCSPGDAPGVKGLSSLSVTGPAGCAPAAQVVRDYVADCAGQDSCVTKSGFRCRTVRFAGDVTKETCRHDDVVVKFGFGMP
jgi:hypothetical protein